MIAFNIVVVIPLCFDLAFPSLVLRGWQYRGIHPECLVYCDDESIEAIAWYCAAYTTATTMLCAQAMNISTEAESGTTELRKTFLTIIILIANRITLILLTNAVRKTSTSAFRRREFHECSGDHQSDAGNNCNRNWRIQELIRLICTLSITRDSGSNIMRLLDSIDSS